MHVREREKKEYIMLWCSSIPSTSFTLCTYYLFIVRTEKSTGKVKPRIYCSCNTTMCGYTTVHVDYSIQSIVWSLTMFWRNLLYFKGTCQGNNLGVRRGKCSQCTSGWYQCVQRYLWTVAAFAYLHPLKTAPTIKRNQLGFLLSVLGRQTTFWSSHLWLLR